jgi:hypothetical protein
MRRFLFFIILLLFNFTDFVIGIPRARSHDPPIRGSLLHHRFSSTFSSLQFRLLVLSLLTFLHTSSLSIVSLNLALSPLSLNVPISALLSLSLSLSLSMSLSQLSSLSMSLSQLSCLSLSMSLSQLSSLSLSLSLSLPLSLSPHLSCFSAITLSPIECSCSS